MRSMLFIPGNNPGMLINADVYGADALILDLEDAVAPDQKDAARILVRNAVNALKYKNAAIIVRVNPLDTAYFDSDIAMAVALRPAMIMPTKVSGADYVREVCARIAAREEQSGKGGIGLIPLIETAEGIENAFEIARADARVKALLLGAEDYSSDIRALRSKAGDEIAYARGRIVNAARAAGIDAYDTPFTDVNDDEGLARDALLARGMGFTGKAAISPRHVHSVNEAFTPSASEIEYAREVLSAIREGASRGAGAVSLRGKMIDKPVVERARRVLETARALGLGGCSYE